MISQTIEYALRAMTYLASLEHGVSVNSQTIADRTKVPQGYLSKILRDLVVAELITSWRGPNGGFRLTNRGGRITIFDIVNAVDPIQRITRCPLGNPHHMELCPLHSRLDNALDTIEREFKRTTLTDLLQDNDGSARRCGGVVSPTVRGKKPTSSVGEPGERPSPTVPGHDPREPNGPGET